MLVWGLQRVQIGSELLFDRNTISWNLRELLQGNDTVLSTMYSLEGLNIYGQSILLHWRIWLYAV